MNNYKNKIYSNLYIKSLLLMNLELPGLRTSNNQKNARNKHRNNFSKSSVYITNLLHTNI